MNALAQNAYNYFAGNIKAYKSLDIEVKENQKTKYGDNVTIIYLYYPIHSEFGIEDEDSKMILENLIDNFIDDEELEEKGFDLYDTMWNGLSVCLDGVELYRVEVMGRSGDDEWDAECEAEGWTHVDTEADFI